MSPRDNKSGIDWTGQLGCRDAPEAHWKDVLVQSQSFPEQPSSRARELGDEAHLPIRCTSQRQSLSLCFPLVPWCGYFQLSWEPNKSTLPLSIFHSHNKNLQAVLYDRWGLCTEATGSACHPSRMHSDEIQSCDDITREVGQSMVTWKQNVSYSFYSSNSMWRYSRHTQRERKERVYTKTDENTAKKHCSHTFLGDLFGLFKHLVWTRHWTGKRMMKTDTASALVCSQR